MLPTLVAIDHIHVFVSDRAHAKDWYDEVLGMKPIQKLEFWADNGGPLTVSDASGNVHLALFESPAQKCRSTVALMVGAAQFVAWKSHLHEKLGHELEAEDHQVSWSMYFQDPDGNPYEITTYEHEEARSQLLNSLVPPHSASKSRVSQSAA